MESQPYVMLSYWETENVHERDKGVAIEIGILRIPLDDQWLAIVLMSGFARMGNNEITI